ncbi:MAG: hypothetical protein KatS3mg102_0029 [Planctomycetota bacterium]|nr:MAG: hypothetical protein KatS3mg102_0029 [Planctomycetota bacterium]
MRPRASEAGGSRLAAAAGAGAAAAGPARLITIPFSHYCEKARWALERAGLPFREEGHPPLVHMVAARWAGGGRTVPVLVAEGEVFADSTLIVRYADRHLPAALRLVPEEAPLRAEAERLERRFDRDLGPHTRRWAYYHLLPRRELCERMLRHGVPAAERALMRSLFGPARWLMRRAMRIDPAAAARSWARIEEVFGEVQALLAGGRRYLLGERFTVADLAFAALASPVLLPAGYPVPLPALGQLPPAMREGIEQLRARPAGRFALQLYAQERARRLVPATTATRAGAAG